MTNQDYAHHWVRDAAIVAMELAALPRPEANGVDVTLCDYVTFSKLCQDSVAVSPGDGFFRACFNIDGTPRAGWSDQRTVQHCKPLAFAAAWPYLDPPTQAVATTVAQRTLTPTKRDVAKLVTIGPTKPEIGARLLISRSRRRDLFPIMVPRSTQARGVCGRDDYQPPTPSTDPTPASDNPAHPWGVSAQLILC